MIPSMSPRCKKCPKIEVSCLIPQIIRSEPLIRHERNCKDMTGHEGPLRHGKIPQVLISHFPRRTWASNRVGFNHYMLGATFVGYHVPSPYNYHNWLSKIAALDHIFLKSAKLKVLLGNMQQTCFCLLRFGRFVRRSWLVVFIGWIDGFTFRSLGSNLHAGFSAKVGNVMLFPAVF